VTPNLLDQTGYGYAVIDRLRRLYRDGHLRRRIEISPEVIRQTARRIALSHDLVHHLLLPPIIPSPH
jgi:hypothetical protein